MSVRGRILLGLALAVLAPPAALALPPLEQLETRIERSPAAQLAERAYETTRDTLSAGQAGVGLSVFGNAGYAHNHDVIDQSRSRTYSQGAGGAGLMLPLLGSRLQLEDALSEQRVQLAQLEGQRQLQRRELLRRLRRTYADYWQAQRLELLAQRYLQDEPNFEHVAELRTRAGLLLDSDRLELLSGFGLARRDEASGGADRQTALALMRELTGSDLDGGMAVRPIVPTACAREVDADDAWADADPELIGLKQVIALRASNPRDNALYPVQSNLQLSYQAKDEVTTGRQGSSTALNWFFQVPLEYRAERRLLARAAAAQLSRARLEYELRREELQQQRRELAARATVLRRGAEFAGARLAAADAAVRERTLRAGKLDGDVLEQLQKAQLQRYNAAKALVEADKELVYWYADWARFETTPCTSAPAEAGPRLTAPDGPTAQRLTPANGPTAQQLIAPGALTAERLTAGIRAVNLESAAGQAADLESPDIRAAAAPPAHRALYLWRSAEWLADAATEQGERKFAELHLAGIARLLVSLDAEQMRHAMADPASLVRAVRRTHEHGFGVELLLGDPSWIRAEHRGKLLAIVAALKSVPFDGLHLDLEPEQLDSSPDSAPELLGSLAQTLAAADAASPWPLELSIHPRNLDVQVGHEKFGEILRRLKVAPTIMVYVANPERALAIAAPLLGRYPDLSFGVAVSLEKSLGPEESLCSYSPAERLRRIERLESELAAANFSGITLQLEDGWSDAGGLRDRCGSVVRQASYASPGE